MIRINTILDGHRLRLSATPVLASGSVAADAVHFEFDDAWQGLAKIALFWRPEEAEPYAVTVDIHSDAVIPWEVLDERRKIKFGVYGVVPGETTPRITSTLITVQVPEGAWSDSILNPGVITPTIIEQFVAEASAAITGSVRYDGPQTLTTAQIIQARANIDAAYTNQIQSRFRGKKISIIGDSIDTFDAPGYKIDGYATYYPALDVDYPDRTWWKQVADASGAKVEVNASWAGSRVTSYGSVPDFYARTSVIGSPEVIFVTLGTNDSADGVALGDYDFATAYTSLSESQFRPAYIKGVKALKALYPNAQIVCIAQKMGDAYRDSILYIARQLGVEFIDASDYAGASGVHPGALGMMQIARLVLYPTDEALWQRHYPADAAAIGERTVRADEAQSFTSAKKAQARANIDGASVYQLANAFSAENSYSIGDLVVYEHQLYRFISEHPAGAWNSQHVEYAALASDIYRALASLATTYVSGQDYPAGEYVIYKNRLFRFTSLNNGTQVYLADIVGRLERSVAPIFDGSKSGGYAAGDIVVHNGQLWAFRTSHTGVWTGTDVRRVSVMDLLDIALTALSRRVDATPQLGGNKLINEANRTFDDSGDSWYITEPLRVYPGQRYEINSWMKYGNGMIAELDENQSIVSVVPHTAGRDEGGSFYHMDDFVYTVPSGISYLVFGVYMGGDCTYTVKQVRYSAVTSLNGQTGDITLNAGSLAYSGSASYAAGSVGKSLHDVEFAELLTGQNVAGEFDPEETYPNGYLVVYNGRLYRFTEPHSGEWTGTDVERTNLATSIARAALSLAEAWDGEHSYPAGAYAMYNGRLWRAYKLNNGTQVYLADIVGRLEGSVAEVFDGGKSGGYATGDVVVHNGQLWAFTEPHSGDWTGQDVRRLKIMDKLTGVCDDMDEIKSIMTGQMADVTPGVAGSYLINEVTGSIQVIHDASSSWKGTALLPVNAGDQLVVTAWMKYQNGFIAALDGSQNVVSIVTHSAGEAQGNNSYWLRNYRYTVPGGTAYLFFAFYQDPDHPFSVKRLEYAFTPKVEDVERIIRQTLPRTVVEDGEEISIASSDKIGFFGNSYLNGYPMRTHHCLDNLSMWSDYLFYNYGKSGDDILNTLKRINDNSPWLGTVGVQEWGITYGVLAMHANDGALFAADPDTFYQNAKHVCEAIRAMGATPILGTEHQQSYRDYGYQRLASEEGYEFWDWAKTAAAMNMFVPFLLRGHPATRTHWLWTYGLKRYIDALPRPMRSIKLFRKRPGVEDSLDALKYSSVIERSQRFVEIYNGSTCLTKATEKYFDRLDNEHDQYEHVPSEYQKLQSGSGAVAFGKYALVECVTPFTAKAVTTLKMHLTATGVVHAYARRILSLAEPLPDSRYIAFGVQSGASALTHGTTFTVTGGVFDNSVKGTYTVDEVVGDVVVTTTSSSGKTTSETDTPTITGVSGVELAGSYEYPSAEYLQRYQDPLCEWDEIALGEDGETDLTAYAEDHMDYDKMAVLLVGNGTTDISVSDVRFTAIGAKRKRAEAAKRPATRVNGISVLTDTLLDNGTAWDGIDSVPKYTPVTGTVGGRTWTDPLPTGITTVRVLQEGASITQNLRTDVLAQDPYHTDRLQIRVIARYFPKYVNSDSAWNTTEIFEGSYDCAQMSVCVDNDVRCGTAQVGAYWNEFLFDVDYFDMSDIKRLKVICDRKSLQIARVEAVLAVVPAISRDGNNLNVSTY